MKAAIAFSIITKKKNYAKDRKKSNATQELKIIIWNKSM